MTLMREEYPRPQLMRDQWLNLNGEWRFAFDDHSEGEAQGWYLHNHGAFNRTIRVPFCFQSKLSGIGDTGFHDTVWYTRDFNIPDTWNGKEILLHFGAVDYEAKVWINGQLACVHQGGHVPFEANVTNLLRQGSNTITVRAFDPSRDLSIPRGKQYWKQDSASIFYTRTTGIWQTVWLEAVETLYIEKVRFTPSVDTEEICIEVFTRGWNPNEEIRLQATIMFSGSIVCEEQWRVNGSREVRRIGLHNVSQDWGQPYLWSPEHPNLFDVQLQLRRNGYVVDEVTSYFGMRTISTGPDGFIYLNNHPYYMRLVLDQGYYPDGILTAPSDDDIRKDVELTKMLGFNGVRKHQKVEDPRYLYWADRLGLLVWGEMPSAYQFTTESMHRITAEWLAVLDRDYNHPSVVVWVPLNESWGVPQLDHDKQQQDFVRALYHLTKALDPTRLVVSNDGWEHVVSDLCTIHDYHWNREVLERRYATEESSVGSRPGGRRIYVVEPGYRGEPILITEFGGIAFQIGDRSGWGYSGAHSEDDFLRRLTDVFTGVYRSPIVHGCCYTQLTDVEQEINGLLTYERTPKAPIEKIRDIVLNRG
ncbi:MAG: glycoside hydrolase family 2 [Alicyclobacillus sp.]|nr:glycoside hydrolase family 2 [Alicyclobacillus sp.]